METPHELRSVDERGGIVRRQDYDDGSVIAVDFGPDVDEVAVDIVDGTAIVVVGDDDRQVEFELPEGADDVSVRNGVLTIEE
jgi:hypothetical protein